MINNKNVYAHFPQAFKKKKRRTRLSMFLGVTFWYDYYKPILEVWLFLFTILFTCVYSCEIHLSVFVLAYRQSQGYERSTYGQLAFTNDSHKAESNIRAACNGSYNEWTLIFSACQNIANVQRFVCFFNIYYAYEGTLHTVYCVLRQIFD